jgi:hypothetical protein
MVERRGDRYFITLSRRCRAPAETVYDLLADLRSHLEWGGSRLQDSVQRLTSLQAPVGPARPGDEFQSVGSTAGRAWHDRSRVVQADRPSLFVFETEGRLEDAPHVEPIEGRWVHRYEIARDDTGCIVTYRMQAQLTMYSPPGHHSRYPAVVYNIVLPSVVERGIVSLVRMAEERAGTATDTSEPGGGAT